MICVTNREVGMRSNTLSALGPCGDIFSITEAIEVSCDNCIIFNRAARYFLRRMERFIAKTSALLLSALNNVTALGRVWPCGRIQALMPTYNILDGAQVLLEANKVGQRLVGEIGVKAILPSEFNHCQVYHRVSCCARTS